MTMHIYIKFLQTLLLVLSVQSVFCQSGNFEGQASGWTFFNDNSLNETRIGLRYIGTASYTVNLDQTKFIDAEFAVNAFANGSLKKKDAFYDDSKIKPYRLWLRFAGSQFEVRAGLQKINFGSALLLRPLMWFDRIDPRDPLGLTDGVYGLLARQYFVNNANLWFWALYGNDKTRGFEIFASDKKVPEYGGRVQLPLGPGEIAFTYHHREANPRNIFPTTENISENRFAVDGKWDAVIGLWFETALTHQDSKFRNLGPLSLNYRKFVTIGADYTFNVRNGLHVLGEHMNLTLSEEIFSVEEKANVTAVMADYSLGLLDQLFAIAYYDWDSEDVSRYLSWRRLYDNWSFFTNFFWNSGQSNLLSFQNNSDFSITGKGLQLMVVYNH